MDSLSEIVDVVIGVDTHVADPYRGGGRCAALVACSPRSPSMQPPRAMTSSSSSRTNARGCGPGRSREPAVTAPG